MDTPCTPDRGDRFIDAIGEQWVVHEIGPGNPPQRYFLMNVDPEAASVYRFVGGGELAGLLRAGELVPLQAQVA